MQFIKFYSINYFYIENSFKAIMHKIIIEYFIKNYSKNKKKIEQERLIDKERIVLDQDQN